MLSHENELADLEAGLLDAPVVARLRALDGRAVMSLHQELRVVSWLAVMTIVTGLGFYIKDNYRTIGTDALILLIAAAAAACYGFVAWRRRLRPEAAFDEYLLLLGGLLISGDVAFFESQHHLFEQHWSTHLLILAAVHAAGAYAFGSKTLLSLSISALAGWFGVERNIESFFSSSAAVGTRAVLCALVLAGWRLANSRGRYREKFEGVFDQFIALLALGGALLWCFDPRWKWIGFLAVMALSVGVWRYAQRSRQISFAVYALFFGYVAFSRMVVDVLGHGGMEILVSLYFMASVPAMIVATIILIRRIDRSAE